MLLIRKNKSKSLESAVKKKLNQYSFKTTDGLDIGIKGNYINAYALKELYRNDVGFKKTVNTEDKTYIADQLMSADMFIDCGNWCCICDVTRNRNVLEKKVSKLNSRLQTAIKNNLTCFKNKPILGGVIICLQYIEQFDESTLDKVYDALDMCQEKVQVINLN